MTEAEWQRLQEVAAYHEAWKAARDRLYNPRQKPAQTAEGIRVAFVPAPAGSTDQSPNVMRDTLREVFADTGVTPEEILGTSRKARIVRARQDAMARVFRKSQWSLTRIGRAFGRDHTTVLHALTRVGGYIPNPDRSKSVLGRRSFIGPRKPTRLTRGPLFIGPRRPAGGLNSATLTAEEVTEIRRIYAAGGTTHRKIAAQFGVGRQCITDVISRKRWRHVP